MSFKDFRFKLIKQIGFLVLCIFFACWFLQDEQKISLGIVALLLACIQVITLIYSIEKSQKDIINFLGFIQYDDFSVTYPTKSQSGITKQLYEEYNKVIKKFRMLRSDKEANLHFFKSILQHIDIGILALNNIGQIKIINTSALRLLNINRLESLSSIRSEYPVVYDTLLALSSKQKTVLKLAKPHESIFISISVIEITINGEEMKFVSMQNIQNELEEKEMEAWQSMIRVITHEIMNSLTPITSLAATVSDEFTQWHEAENIENTIKIAETKDMQQAMATIKKRSEGLLHFVEDFRNLSQIPKPKSQLFELKSFFEGLYSLLKKDFLVNNIEIKIAVDPENISLMADAMLIEQVLINVLKNAIESFETNTLGKKIEISTFYSNDSKIEIWVKDNGIGIVDEVLEKVFIPFYSTKKTGSGIGLTISKQIMRMHKGSIKISSDIGKGTLVKLIF